MKQQYGEIEKGLYGLETAAARLQDGGRWGDWRVSNTAENRYFDADMHLGPVLHQVIGEGDSVLDLGCSDGVTTYDLEKRYEEREVDVYGVDAGSRAGTAGPDAGEADFIQGICPGLPFDTGSIDTVVAANSVHITAQQFQGFEQDDFISDTLAELARVSAPHGDLVLAETDGNSYIHMEQADRGWAVVTARGYGQAKRGGEPNVMMPTSLFPWITHDDVRVDEDELSVYVWDGRGEVQADPETVDLLQ